MRRGTSSHSNKSTFYTNNVINKVYTSVPNASLHGHLCVLQIQSYPDKAKRQLCISQDCQGRECITKLCGQSDNTVHPLRNHIAKQTKAKKTPGDAKEPIKVFNVLAWNDTVHTPNTSDNVHGQDDSTKDGKLAEDVGSLLLTLVHADVDLREVVAVCSRQETAIVSKDVKLSGVNGLTSRNDSSYPSW